MFLQFVSLCCYSFLFSTVLHFISNKIFLKKKCLIFIAFNSIFSFFILFYFILTRGSAFHFVLGLTNDILAPGPTQNFQFFQGICVSGLRLWGCPLLHCSLPSTMRHLSSSLADFSSPSRQHPAFFSSLKDHKWSSLSMKWRLSQSNYISVLEISWS